LPELPEQEKEGLVSSGAVSEFEQPARLSARSAPRGRRVRMGFVSYSCKMERTSGERVGAAAARRVSPLATWA
jgi:hypothetical protein